MAEQRYRVIDRLEAGGMAEVFRGEALSVQGFKKQVAIKRVLPNLAQNKSFIRMFLDEARLGARLNHANIVTVFDIGAADNTYFIVMEFVDGANLKTVLETLKKQGRRPGVKEMLYIGMEVCRGLAYAHDIRDDAGTLLNIVHRDISPPNILITKGGEVKVTDFGLAKATTQLEKTDPGVVKGKFSYLSPEAAMGLEVDARADLFAVGIVIWEALAGRRLFLGESDYETVKKVQKSDIPSLGAINPEVDADLEALLGKIMAKDREQRFQTAHDVQDAIADYLFARRMKVTSSDVGRMMQAVVALRAQEKQRERERKADHSIIDQLIQDELLAFTSLDEMNDPLNPASGSAKANQISKTPKAGAKPLDATSFNAQLENPANWFSEDDIDQATSFFDRSAIPGSRASDPRELAALLEEEDEKGEDRKTGAEALGDMLDNEVEANKTQPPSPAAAPAARASKPPPANQPALSVAKESGGGSMKYVVLALVILLGAGAAAWFGNLIPH
ncbi:MAG: serine/threonine-protein kinase [Myxococcales bacterium]